MLMSGIYMTGSIQGFLSGLFGSVANWGSWIVGIIGGVMVIVGIYQIAKGLMSGGKGQTNWAMAILCLLLGGALAASGAWGMLKNFTGAASATADSIAQGNADGDVRSDEFFE